MLCIPKSTFVGLGVGFMYSKTIPEISSKNKIMFKAVPTGYQLIMLIQLQ